MGGESIPRPIRADIDLDPITGIGAHAHRAIAPTNEFDHQADIAKVQKWLEHPNVATTRMCVATPIGRSVLPRS